MKNDTEAMEQDQRDYLKGLLVEEKVQILFTKVDGSGSELIGTTCAKYLPIVVEAFGKAFGITFGKESQET